MNREVVALRGAGGEHNLFARLGIDEPGDAVTRVFDGGFRAPAESVRAARGVAEVLREIREHRLEHARVERRGGVIVEVDGELQSHGAFKRRARPSRAPELGVAPDADRSLGTSEREFETRTPSRKR